MPGHFFSLFTVRFSLLSIFFPALLVALVFGPALGGGFLFDDFGNLLENEYLRIKELSFDSLRSAALSGAAGPLGRPVAYLSFALNYYVNSSFDPHSFKAVNLALHGLTAIIVALFSKRLLDEVHPSLAERQRIAIAIVLSALWALHPIQLLPIAHVVQRMTILSALFLFCALWLHTVSRNMAGNRGILGLGMAWCALWPLSFLSKENGLLFPLFVLAWEVIVRPRQAGRLDGFAKALSGLCLLVATIGLIWLLSQTGNGLLAGYEYRDFTLYQRLLTEGRVLWFYISLIALPHLESFGLYHDAFPVSKDILDPLATLFAWPAIVFVLGVAWHFRKKSPLASFGVFLFFIGHALESSILPLELVHEHRNYLPLFGLLLAAAEVVLVLARRGAGLGKTVALALCASLSVYYVFTTVLRAHQYGEDLRRTQLEVEHHPDSARAQYEAGRYMAGLPTATRAGSMMYVMARLHYEKSFKLNSQIKIPLVGMLYLECRAGAPVPKWAVGELAKRLRETPFTPGDSSVMFSIRNLLMEVNHCLGREDVDLIFEAALGNSRLKDHPRMLIHAWYADSLVYSAREYQGALVQLGKASQLHPMHPSVQLRIIQLEILSGHQSKAREMMAILVPSGLSPPEREIYHSLQECLSLPDAECHL